MIPLRIPLLPKPTRLDTFLVSWSPFIDAIGTTPSRSEIARRIEAGAILLNNITAKPSILLEGGETLLVDKALFLPQETPLLPEPNLPIRLVFENDSFLIADKSAHIDTHPSATKRSGTLVNWLISRFPDLPTDGDTSRPGIVHRLDRDTSGLIIVAKTLDALRELKELFKCRSIQKTYLALVTGIPKEKEGRITTSIARSAKGGKQAIATENRRTKGTIRPAETIYRVLDTFETAALVEVQPKTGRTHQIRIHLASIGHPVFGDTLYGGKTGKHSPFPRHLLHAARLSFSFRGQPFDFESPLPADFQNILNHLQRTK